MEKRRPAAPHFMGRLTEITSRQQPTQRTSLDWPGRKKLKPEGGKRSQKLKSGKLKLEIRGQGTGSW
jgi:hypothetical protein